MSRWSLRFPITLGIILIVVLVVLIVGWVLLTVFSAAVDPKSSVLYYTLLSVGTTFLAFVVVGVVIYLTLSIKAINLTKRQANFIDSVTHELKSPIASMKLALQTINHRRVDSRQREKINRIMLEDIERLDRLINHVLDAAKLDKAQVEVDAKDVELGELLADCAKSVCLRYHVPAEVVHFDLVPCTVHAPAGDLDMIFRNLIDNAVKYAGAEPRVDVTLRPAGTDRIVVRISDNGPGIPPSLRRKIFGRFVRLGNELERTKRGTGLGLYIVRTLVRRLRGEVRVRDSSTGTGTVFEVSLPGEAAAELASSKESGGKQTESMQQVTGLEP